MIFLEWQFGVENQMLLKCAYVAIPTLGIYPKNYPVSEKMIVQRFFRTILLKLARIENNLNAQQQRISQVNDSVR